MKKLIVVSMLMMFSSTVFALSTFHFKGGCSRTCTGDWGLEPGPGISCDGQQTGSSGCKVFDVDSALTQNLEGAGRHKSEKDIAPSRQKEQYDDIGNIKR